MGVKCTCCADDRAGAVCGGDIIDVCDVVGRIKGSKGVKFRARILGFSNLGGKLAAAVQKWCESASGKRVLSRARGVCSVGLKSDGSFHWLYQLPGGLHSGILTRRVRDPAHMWQQMWIQRTQLHFVFLDTDEIPEDDGDRPRQPVGTECWSCCRGAVFIGRDSYAIGDCAFSPFSRGCSCHNDDDLHEDIDHTSYTTRGHCH